MERCFSLDGRSAPALASRRKCRAFAKVLARSENSHRRLIHVQVNGGTPVFNYVELVSGIALAKYKFTGSVVRAANAFGTGHLQLRDVWPEQSAPGPVNCHLHLAQECRHLCQVGATPEKPRRKTGKMKPKNFGHGIVMTD